MRRKKLLLAVGLLLATIGFSQQPGNSLNFDGTNDYVTLGDNDGMTAITIETWLFYQEDGLKFICSKGGEHLEIHTNTGGNLRFIPVAGVYIDAANVLSVNQWTHISCVYDPAASLAKIYISGTEVPVVKSGASPLTTPIANNTTNFNIGRRADGTFYYKGNFDEVRIWNVARTAQEIADNFAIAIDPASETNLVSYYNFNQGTANGDNTAITSLTDLKGSYNGTFNNFALNGNSSNFVGSYAMVIPTATSSTNPTETGFTANWIAPSIGTVDNYLLYVATNSNFTNLVSGYNPLTVDASTFSATVTGLTSGNCYYYRVAARNTTLSMISANSNSIIFGTSVSQNSFEFKQEGESKNCEIYSDRNWTATSSETWLTFNATNGNGNYTLVMTADENNSGTMRTATVTISSANQTNIIINITQISISGAGTVEDPYKIYSYADLCQIDNVNYSFSAVYELANDIDASASHAGEGFLPIGNYLAPFTGQFYGNGYTISNLYINRPSSNEIGLFGYCENATIKDLNLYNIEVYGKMEVGGLIGLSSTCTIDNCHVIGKIYSTGYCVGGLLGSSYVCQITNSSSKGKVSGLDQVGGFCGYSSINFNISNCFSYANVTGTGRNSGGFLGNSDEGGTVTKCFATGDVSGLSDRVGIGGFCGNNNVSLNDCYSTGNVYAPSMYSVGGFIGGMTGDVSSCYSTGNVRGNTDVGGFVGSSNTSITNFSYSSGKVSGDIIVASFVGDNLGTVNNSVSNSQLSGQSIFANGGTQNNCYLKNTEEMQMQTTFSGFDFTTKWQIRENQTYPAIQGINNAPFAFADTISKHNLNFSFAELLANDYDYETLQTALCLKIQSVEAGTFNNESVMLSNEFPVNTQRKVVYRVGEIIAAGDTLWGNRAEAVLKVTNAKPVIIDVDNLSTLMNTPIRILSENISFTDADNDPIQSIKLLSGENYGFVGTSILPAHDFIGEIYVPVKINDGFEWSDSLILTITISAANTAPVITSTAPTATTVGQEYIYEVIATDSENDELTYSLLNAPAGMIITNNIITWTPTSGTTTSGIVTVAVSDGLSNDAENFIVFVSDIPNTAPVITSTAPTTATVGQEYLYEVIATDAENDELTYSLLNAPAGMIITDNIITWTPTSGTTTSGIVTVTVSDGLLNDTESFIVFVSEVPNTAPVITSTAPTTATVGLEYVYEIIATDAEGNPLTYSLSNAPAGMIITDDIITWTPTSGTTNSGIVTVTVSDGLLNDTESFIVFVSEVPNTAPVITSTAPTTATVGQEYIYEVIATDSENDELTYSLLNAPAGMEITDNVITWTPDENVSNSGIVTVTVSDGILSSFENFIVMVFLPTNTAPVITSTAPLTAIAGQEYVYNVIAEDADNDTLTYTLTNQPNGMIITDNVIIWTPLQGTSNSGIVTLTVSDGQLYDYENFVVSVSPPANTAPQITSTAPTAATVGQEYVYTVVAQDSENDELTYTLSNAPVGMIITDSIITWTPQQGITNSGIVSITVSDGLLSDVENFIVFVATVGIADLYENDISVYPNPTRGMLTLSSKKNKVKNIIVTDITGKTILSFSNSQIPEFSNLEIDISNYEQGIYLLKIETENGFFVEKIKKE